MHNSVATCIRFFSIIFSSGLFGNAVVAQGLQPPEDVAFTSKLDGTEQRYVVLLPDKFRPNIRHDLMIALHGHGSDRWQFINDARAECRGSRDMAVQRSMIYVSPDYRGRTSWMGPAAESDMLQLMDELHARWRIRDVVICGGSMGGTSALAFAALHPDSVDGVVSLNGTANMLEYAGFADPISESYGGAKTDNPEVYRQRSAELFPERLTMPVATTTGGKDVLVPPDSTLRLVESLKRQASPVLSIHRPDGGHETNDEDTVAAFRFVFDQLDRKNATEPPPALSSLATETSIVCLGDSVTGVYYHTGGRRAYPEMLELAIKATHPDAKVRVINAGISGHTTADGLARLETDVLSHHPALVTISFGLNDMTRIPPEQFRSNLVQLIDLCRSQESQVVLCTPNAVMETSGRPIAKLIEYCQIIREVGRDRHAVVCDQFWEGERLRSRAPWTWRLTMSDEIHPNMDGHKRMAEELCRCITGSEVSLDSVEPPQPALARTRSLLAAGKRVKLLVVEPLAAVLESSLRRLNANVVLETTTWAVHGKTILQLEQEAATLVRPMKPDLVVLTIPSDAASKSDEQCVHSISWIMNWSLSFGIQEWDCVVVHPSVLDPATDPRRSALIRRLVHAQHLELIDRAPNDESSAEDLVRKWMVARGN